MAGASRRAFGRGAQVGERGVGDLVGVHIKCGRVAAVKALDQVLGRQSAAAAGACLDARCLVDLVSECRDLSASAGGDLADVKIGPPVQTEAEDNHSGSTISAQKPPSFNAAAA